MKRFKTIPQKNNRSKSNRNFEVDNKKRTVSDEILKWIKIGKKQKDVYVPQAE